MIGINFINVTTNQVIARWFTDRRGQHKRPVVPVPGDFVRLNVGATERTERWLVEQRELDYEDGVAEVACYVVSRTELEERDKADTDHLRQQLVATAPTGHIDPEFARNVREAREREDRRVAQLSVPHKFQPMTLGDITTDRCMHKLPRLKNGNKSLCGEGAAHRIHNVPTEQTAGQLVIDVNSDVFQLIKKLDALEPETVRSDILHWFRFKPYDHLEKSPVPTCFYCGIEEFKAAAVEPCPRRLEEVWKEQTGADKVTVRPVAFPPELEIALPVTAGTTAQHVEVSVVQSEDFMEDANPSIELRMAPTSWTVPVDHQFVGTDPYCKECTRPRNLHPDVEIVSVCRSCLQADCPGSKTQGGCDTIR